MGSEGGVRVVAVDFETTGHGLNPFSSRLLEYGAVDAEGSELGMLVNHATPVPPRITEVTGITDAEVEERGVDAFSAASQFLKFIGVGTGTRVLLVAHNATFDSRHLAHELATLKLGVPSDVWWWDSMATFQMMYPAAPRSRLADMVRAVHADTGFVTSHRAKDDARAVMQCMQTIATAGSRDGELLGLYRATVAAAWPAPPAPL